MKTFITLLFISFQALGADLVPSGIVTFENKEEKIYKTPKGTLVTIEFDDLGFLEDVSGKAADGGDIFTPEDGSISLASAVASLKKSGKKPSGEWTYEKIFIHGWVYEFEGNENQKKMEYKIKASTGELISSSVDNN